MEIHITNYLFFLDCFISTNQIVTNKLLFNCYNYYDESEDIYRFSMSRLVMKNYIHLYKCLCLCRIELDGKRKPDAWWFMPQTSTFITLKTEGWANTNYERECPLKKKYSTNYYTKLFFKPFKHLKESHCVAKMQAVFYNAILD